MTDAILYREALNQGMQALKHSLSALIEKLPAGVPVVYIDYPLHLNVGDLLINLGLERLLQAHGRPILYRFNVKNFHKFSHLIKQEHTLLLHGGGNFGDIWHTHENLRQEIVGKFTKNKIVLFPQTAHFNDMAKVEQYAKVYRAHPDFFMFLRDQRSYDFVKDQFKIPCALAPDTAHFLWQNNDFIPDDAGKGEMVFIRRDVEASTANQQAGSVDWDDLISKYDYGMFKLIEIAIRKNRLKLFQPILQKIWYAYRNYVVHKSVRYFNRFDHIHTDRLHAIILGSLLGKRLTMKDNNYGKLSTYCNNWMLWIT